jgi:hypothetical protein
LNRFGRQVGFETGHIDLLTTIKYCEIYEFSRSELEQILSLDTILLPILKEKSKQAKKEAPKKTPTKRRH